MLEKIKIGVSGLSNKIQLYRMGKDPRDALETKDITTDAVAAVVEHLIAKPGMMAALEATHTKYGASRFVVTLKVQPIPDLGTLIQATQRPCDLLPAFWKELARLNTEKAIDSITEHFCDEDVQIYSLIASAKSGEWPDEADPVWDRHEVFEYINGVLMEQLDVEGHPFNFYFGANEGDGSDYGFWKNETPSEQS